MSDRLLTIDEVASIFGVSRRQIYRFIDEGILTVVKLGKLTRILQSVVEAALERLRKGGKL